MRRCPNETFIYKVGYNGGTLKLHCAIVMFHFKRRVCGRPLCKLDGELVSDNVCAYECVGLLVVEWIF